MSLRLKHLVLAGLAGLGLIAAAPASAEPALWAIKSGQSTIYLFGTFHVLPDGMGWETPKIAKAFETSDALWLELIDDDPQTLMPLITRYGSDPGHPLSSKISAQDLPRLDAAAKAAGVPGGESGLEPLRPWLAALTLSAAPVQQAGFDPEAGADHILKHQAEAAGKPLHGFETAQQQIRFFADLPAADEVAILTSTLDDVAAGPAKIKEMADAWGTGDVTAIGNLFAEFKAPRYRTVYKVLIADRNRAWADQLEQQLKTGSGTIFVAVGAGHLAGPDSLIAMLAERGIKAERQ